jgi:hypothetical protein
MIPDYTEAKKGSFAGDISTAVGVQISTGPPEGQTSQTSIISSNLKFTVYIKEGRHLRGGLSVWRFSQSKTSYAKVQPKFHALNKGL